MRILVLCHELPPLGGGAAAVCSALCSHYVEAGHSVTAVTMSYGELPSKQLLNGYEIFRIHCGRRRKEMASPLEGLAWAQKCWPVVKNLHALDPFDVAHAHFIMPAGIVSSRLRNKGGVPFIVTPHGSDVPGYNRERLRLAHILVKPWWKKICRHADCIVCPSESLLKLIKASTDDFRWKVIPNGFEIGRFKSLEKEKRILLCSRLVERKGFHYFLEAIRDLDLPGWEVDIVGDGPMYQSLSAMAARCSIPVHMYGWIDNTDPKLAKLYGSAMIFVFPSEWENFSIALLEAMSAGCAVITTNVSGNPEAIGDTGCLIQPNDVKALRSAVLDLTENIDHCLLMGELAARRAAHQFDWKIIANRYLQLLESLAMREE